MITINGFLFREIPAYCGVCPGFLAGNNDKVGFCVLFEKRKPRYNNIPKRCNALFTKGFAIGGDLVITKNI